MPDLSGVDPAAWDALDHGPSPFTEHGFLRALERSGSVGEGTGWEPHHVLVERAPGEGASEGEAEGASERSSSSASSAGSLVGAVACYRKMHSYGEYIFDFAWARASMQAGLPYYPKLVIAAPVTPATGHRLLLARGLGPDEREAVIEALLRGVHAVADELECGSVHWLFCSADEHDRLARAGHHRRASFQFHWHNHGYADFEAFLATLASRKRKQIRKERRRALQAVDGPVCLVPAAEWTRRDIASLEAFYRRTCHMHGNDGYLTPEFFELLPALLPQRARLARVQQSGETVAGALYFQTEHALYGRYWGCRSEIPFLHFEVAYYAGIEHCIREGLPLFEAGAQGEHKLLRGFLPAPTYSNHWMRHPGLRQGVERFLRGEARELVGYMDHMRRYSPYRKDDDGEPLPLPQRGVGEAGEGGERAAAEGDDTLDVG
ncbi:MAG: GNAT family N-acetyltransferase [Myxococcales bacterium]|nr:GNAT family N-acetyltransferase [Myxococcales bacterium]